MTVRDLLVRAFKAVHVLGVGESMTTEEAADALLVLNGIIEQANIDKMLGYYQTEVVFPFQANKLSYTIGPASSTPDVTAVRPVEILSAFSRRQSVDLPIFVTHQKSDYDLIQQKDIGISGWEQVVYYQAGWPKGTLYFYMKPLDTLTEAHLTVTADISSFATLDDAVSMPPGYVTWLQYKTAQRLAPEYGMVFTQDMKDILTDAEGAVKRNNLKPFPVAGTGLTGLGQGQSGKFNVYSDTTRR